MPRHSSEGRAGGGATRFQPTISETSRCLAAELSPIAERQAEEQAQRFARLEALRDEVAKARQADETFRPTTNTRPRRRGGSSRSSSCSSPSGDRLASHRPGSPSSAAVFASTPPSAAPRVAAAEDLSEEEVRGLWDAFASTEAEEETTTAGLTAAGACRLLAALGLLSSGRRTPTPPSPQARGQQDAVREKFLRALGLPTDPAAEDAETAVVPFERFYFVFTRVWRAGSCTPTQSAPRPRSSPRSSSRQASVDVAKAPSTRAASERRKRVSFQLPDAPRTPTVAPTEEVVACELSTEEDDVEEDVEETEAVVSVGDPSPEPRNPHERLRRRSPTKPDHAATLTVSAEVSPAQGLSESPPALDVDEATPTGEPPARSSSGGGSGGARLVRRPSSASASPRSRPTPTRPLIATSAHVLTPTLSTRQKQQAKRPPYDPMAECTFAPVTTPYTPHRSPASSVVEASTSPTPPPASAPTTTTTTTPTPSMSRAAAPAGFDKAVQRLQSARARPPTTAATATTTAIRRSAACRPSMFARPTAPAPPPPQPAVVDLYSTADDTEDEVDPVRLYVDVDLPAGGTTVRVPVYADDTPSALAAEFAQTYQLDAVHQRRLEDLLSSLPPC